MFPQRKDKVRREADTDDVIVVSLDQGDLHPRSKIVFTSVSSNYYTSQNFTADTCCNCEKT